MKKTFKIMLKIIIAIIILLFIAFMIIFHSPYKTLKELWVTTAMKTMNHQYLAYWFVSDEEIAEIMDKNKVLEPVETIDLDNIYVASDNKITPVDDTKSKENERNNARNRIEKIDIDEDGFKGNLLIVHDPSRIFVGVSDKLGACGQKLLDMTKSYDAACGINAGGFEDTDGVGDGGSSTTMVFDDKIINSPCSTAGPRYLPNAFLISKPVQYTTLSEK